LTFVLSCVTDRAVLQVSDRRLVEISGQGVHRIIDDESNKAILVCGRVAFAYTGIANLEQTRTDRWFAQVVAAAGFSGDFRAICDHVQATATAAFEKLCVDAGLRRHAFQGVGWFRPRGETSLRPGVLTISNALSEDGRWLSSAAPTFTTRVLVPSDLPEGFLLESVGVDPSAAERRAIWRLVRRCARTRAGAGAFLRAMIVAVRWLGRRYAVIGPSLMAICLPKSAAEETERSGSFTAMASSPTDSRCTFLNIPPAGPRPISFGPHAVCGGSVIMDVEIHDLT